MVTLDRRPEVLIADDEEAICFALSREVRRRGWTPLVAPDGARAIALARLAGPDLLAAVLDVRMPRLDGISAALAIHAARTQLPLALMSAFGDCSLPASLLSETHFFRKPFDLRAFSDWLARVVVGRAIPGQGSSESGTVPGDAGAA